MPDQRTAIVQRLDRDRLQSLLAVFQSEDASLHLRAARWISRFADSQAIDREELDALLGPYRENIDCLLSQELSHYETMFLERSPWDGTRLDATQARVWSHRGQITERASQRIRELVARLPDPVEICEVGSFIGRGSTRAFIDALRDLGKRGSIHCVDTWTPRIHLDYFEANMRQFGARHMVTPLRSRSTEASLTFEDGRFDLVYLDALPDYRSVMSDLCNWYPKVKVGGILCGDRCEATSSACVPEQLIDHCQEDWVEDLVVYAGNGQVRRGGHPGVIRAVDEFFQGTATVCPRPESQWFFVVDRDDRRPGAVR